MSVERRERVIAIWLGSTGNGRNPMFNGRRQPSRGGTSRMTRECQVRFCERLGVKFPGPTRHEQTNRPRQCMVCLCLVNRLQSAGKLLHCGIQFVLRRITEIRVRRMSCECPLSKTRTKGRLRSIRRSRQHIRRKARVQMTKLRSVDRGRSCFGREALKAR
jgi:hypothetical protein